MTQQNSQEGAEEQQQEEFDDNNEQEQDLNNSVDIPLFRTEEGRYLANGMDKSHSFIILNST